MTHHAHQVVIKSFVYFTKDKYWLLLGMRFIRAEVADQRSKTLSKKRLKDSIELRGIAELRIFFCEFVTMDDTFHVTHYSNSV